MNNGVEWSVVVENVYYIFVKLFGEINVWNCSFCWLLDCKKELKLGVKKFEIGWWYGM